MRREELDLGQDMTDEELLAADIDIYERLEESRRLAAELPVLAVMHALAAGRSPTPGLSLAALKREVNETFHRTVAR